MDIFDDEIIVLRGAVNARILTPATGLGEDVNPMNRSIKANQ